MGLWRLVKAAAGFPQWTHILVLIIILVNNLEMFERHRNRSLMSRSIRRCSWNFFVPGMKSRFSSSRTTSSRILMVTSICFFSSRSDETIDGALRRW